MREARNNHDWLAETFLARPKIITNRIFPFPICVWRWKGGWGFAQVAFPSKMHEWLSIGIISCGRLMEERSRAADSLIVNRRLITARAVGSSKEVAWKGALEELCWLPLNPKPSPTTHAQPPFPYTAFIIAIICFVFFDTQRFFVRAFAPHKIFSFIVRYFILFFSSIPPHIPQ